MTATPGTIVREDVDTRYHRPDQGDHERFAHYVRSKDGRHSRDLILEARINGTTVKALCGKEWVPERDPDRFPICPACIELRRQTTGGA